MRGEHDVLGLEVAVHDGGMAGVQVLDRAADANEPPAPSGCAERSLLRSLETGFHKCRTTICTCLDMIANTAACKGAGAIKPALMVPIMLLSNANGGRKERMNVCVHTADRSQRHLNTSLNAYTPFFVDSICRSTASRSVPPSMYSQTM